jgi:serine/threonine protein kinase
MNPHRWQKINELFQEANSLPPQDRGEFLNQACLDDDELRREIESLLAKQSEAEYFFEQAIAQRAETTLISDRKNRTARLTVACSWRLRGRWPPLLKWPDLMIRSPEKPEDGPLIGTPSYMSPEQLSGGVVGEESDIFALGVMLVEALTGQRPFQGQNQAELLRSILTQPLRLPAEINDLSQLNQALQKCLAKNVLERFRTIAEAKAEIITALQALEL